LAKIITEMPLLEIILYISNNHMHNGKLVLCTEFLVMTVNCLLHWAHSQTLGRALASQMGKDFWHWQGGQMRLILSDNWFEKNAYRHFHLETLFSVDQC
jgi:hypothetical protein